MSTLAGLAPEFEPTVSVLTSRVDSYNVRTASALLLGSEKRGPQQSILPESPKSTNLIIHPKKP